MLNKILMRFMHCCETIKEKGMSGFIKEQFYINRKAIILEKKLTDTSNIKYFCEQKKIKFIEINYDNINNYQFYSKDRYYKSLYYSKNRYGGFAFLRENKIIGDMWYYASNISDKPIHIEWLGIENWPDDYVYTFDIFVVPSERGDNLSTLLQNMAMYSLFNKGYLKAYTYCWADNLPSIWMTRVVNKWKEVGTVKMSRFLFVKIGAKGFLLPE